MSHECAQSLRLARARDEHDGDDGADNERSVAQDVLAQLEARAADLGACGNDFENIVHAAGLEIINLDMAHDEDGRLARLRICQTLRVDAEQPDEIRARALTEFEKVRVIDDAA